MIIYLNQLQLFPLAVFVYTIFLFCHLCNKRKLYAEQHFLKRCFCVLVTQSHTHMLICMYQILIYIHMVSHAHTHLHMLHTVHHTHMIALAIGAILYCCGVDK